MLGLRFCARAFSSCGKWGPLFIALRGPLTIADSLFLWSTGSRRTGSVVVAHGLSCSVACGILPDQGSNPCPLHWQADSQPLRHQGSPQMQSLELHPRPQETENLGAGPSNLLLQPSRWFWCTKVWESHHRRQLELSKNQDICLNNLLQDLMFFPFFFSFHFRQTI